MKQKQLRQSVVLHTLSSTTPPLSSHPITSLSPSTHSLYSLPPLSSSASIALPPSPSLCHHPLRTHLFLESIRVRLTSFPLTLLLRLDTLLESLLPMEPFLLPSLLSSPPGRGDVRKKRGSSSCCTPSSGSASD